jgi:hypothetical protein
MKLLKFGARWSVGDRKTIKVLSDYWIPNVRPEMLRPLTPVPAGATVSFLHYKNYSAWDADVVRTIFEEEVANHILQIPISKRVGADFISWPYTKFNVYTVHSAYHIARAKKFFADRSKVGGSASSNAQDDGRLWKKL